MFALPRHRYGVETPGWARSTQPFISSVSREMSIKLAWELKTGGFDSNPISSQAIRRQIWIFDMRSCDRLKGGSRKLVYESGELPTPPIIGVAAAVAEWYRHRIVAGFVTSSGPVPLKTRRVGQRCTLNLSRAETSSRWCGVVVRRGGASSGVVHVT
ncbi:uncharacterized protein TNCV_2895551 [Trichonephila clavipes]|nr:uncharacterized protein TNCV_2895551 [Trichonephila clavipes]